MSKNNNLDFVYKEEILERSINPGFSSELSKVDKFISGLNPFCGDEVKFHFNLNQDIITNIYLELEGCAIHKASSSLLAEIIQNENINVIPDICDEFISFFNTFSLIFINRVTTNKTGAVQLFLDSAIFIGYLNKLRPATIKNEV